MKLADMTTEQLTEHRLKLQEEVGARRDEVRAINRELDRRHDIDVARELAAKLSPAQRAILAAELENEAA